MATGARVRAANKANTTKGHAIQDDEHAHSASDGSDHDVYLSPLKRNSGAASKQATATGWRDPFIDTNTVDPGFDADVEGNDAEADAEDSISHDEAHLESDSPRRTASAHSDAATSPVFSTASVHASSSSSSDMSRDGSPTHLLSDHRSSFTTGTQPSRTPSISTATTTATTVAPSQIAAQIKRPGQPQFEGFWQVRSMDDLRPMLDCSAIVMKQRRADPEGGFVSPLKALTSYLHHTYHLVNPSFVYELAFNPRRVLTKPSKPVYNDGHDNEESDYILYVNDWLGTEDGYRYLILDVLGQGTFGQVVKCQNMATHEIVAVKVIKNKTAYFNQSMMEVTILETLNQHWDPHDEHNILRLQHTFTHAKHLCLVFELLSSNLYELIKQNSFRGLSTSLVRVFITQLLDALVVLKDARLIHCDLKPENILLRTLEAPSIKLVDFGSACHEQQTVYTYIQSRFYRSPEVLLGLSYNSSIDMWSLGCIAAELFLGLPLFPGTSEYNQISRIVDMLGLPPDFMLENGRQSREFFNVHLDAYGRPNYAPKPMDQYSREHRVHEQASKQYFPGRTLPEIIRLAPLSRRSGRAADTDKEMANRAALTDFVAGLLNLDPIQRWTPQQARLHPFITGETFTGPFRPPHMSDPRLYPELPHAEAQVPSTGVPNAQEDTYYEFYGDSSHAYHNRPDAMAVHTGAPPQTYSNSIPNPHPAQAYPHGYPQQEHDAWTWSTATPLASNTATYNPTFAPNTGHFSVVMEPFAPEQRGTPRSGTIRRNSALNGANLLPVHSTPTHGEGTPLANTTPHASRHGPLPEAPHAIDSPTDAYQDEAAAMYMPRYRSTSQHSASLLPVYVKQVPR
ncbi:dual-specificity kinase [Malassezia vespertilionis]|uniref:Yak1p n=1 Tax=Malassezia vespertilionis TaxID=2020962 RepID=A0A2N1JAC3_9BASI|nr:dual-specificity kinase [Malassezia vespertilionis]PKI83452.1 Yak1p [Malassezia vespertilionis]WFD07321.1 dual-specificity kinase [Malassezia vespertilionis]